MLSQSQRGGASPARSPAPDSAAAPVKRMALSDFEKLVTIAKGSFGTVYKGVFRNNENLQPVAIKTLRATKITPSVVEHFLNEVRIMAPLK